MNFKNAVLTHIKMKMSHLNLKYSEDSFDYELFENRITIKFTIELQDYKFEAEIPSSYSNSDEFNYCLNVFFSDCEDLLRVL